MRLPGDTACFVELSQVSVLPTREDPDQRPFLKGAEASVACAAVAGAGAWSVTVSGGELGRFLLAGDRVTITGVRRGTGDRFAVPVTLACTVPGRPARFELPQVKRHLPRWALAG